MQPKARRGRKIRAGLGFHPIGRRQPCCSPLRAGVITTLAAILGHDMTMLMRVYGHQIPFAEDTAAKALQQALAGAPNGG